MPHPADDLAQLLAAVLAYRPQPWVWPRQQSVMVHPAALQLFAYYRVSTDRQGQSGLGLDAQRLRIEELAAARGAVLVAEFTEIESGRKNHRPVLA